MYNIGDDVTVNGRWHIVLEVEQDDQETMYFLANPDGDAHWFREEQID